MPLGFEVTRYELIDAPPLKIGASKDTVAEVVPVAVAVPIIGASGSDGLVVIAAEALEDIDVPTELVAVTVNV